jgi:hypothetical protein
VSDPESEPDSSSLNMAFAAAAGGDIANSRREHRPATDRTRARESPRPAPSSLADRPRTNERGPRVSECVGPRAAAAWKERRGFRRRSEKFRRRRPVSETATDGFPARARRGERTSSQARARGSLLSARRRRRRAVDHGPLLQGHAL